MSSPSTQLSPKDFALFLAIDHNDLRALDSAIAAGGDPNCQDKSLTSPLIAAINTDKPAMVEALLKAGANPNMADAETGSPPLAFAFYDSTSASIAKSLIDAGADPLWSAPGNGGDPTLARIARDNKRPDLLKFINDARAERARASVNSARQAGSEQAMGEPIATVESLSEAQIASLAKSLGSGRINEMATALGKLAAASISDAVSDAQWPSLQASVKDGLSRSSYGAAQLARAMIDQDSKWSAPVKFNAEVQGAAPQDCEDYGSFFDRASAHGKVAEIEFWSAACGPDWNPDGGSNPLVWSIYGGSLDSAKTLLALGANPNGESAPPSAGAGQEVEVSNDSPLVIALANGHVDIALALLAKGARATDADLDSMERARASIDDQSRQGVVAELGSLLMGQDVEAAARAVAGLASLCVQGWTREEDFEKLAPAAASACARFGSNFALATRAALEPVSKAEIEFDAVLEPRTAPKTYSGSILDRAAATGARAALGFFATCAGPDWNPDGGDRPIDWAASVGDARAIELLAKLGAPLETSEHTAPLSNAVLGGWGDAARALIDFGADPAGLSPSELGQAGALLGAEAISSVADNALAMLRSADPDESYFGLRQVWNLSKAGWISDWAEAGSALDQIGFAPHIERAKSGNTQAGDSILREGGYLHLEAGPENSLGGKLNHFSRMAHDGDLDACRFLARALGPDFHCVGDNGSPLANAVCGKQIDTARMLISMGAKLDIAEGSLLGLASANKDSAMFLMLASQGARSDSLSESDRSAACLFLASKANQQALLSIIPDLPAEEEGFDQFIANGSMPSSMMGALLRSGQKERFWRNRDRIDWTRDASALIDAANADGEAGLGAYAKFRRALSADDIDAARAAVESTPALLASLSKRSLADEAIMACLGAGRSSLMKAMADCGWPMEATMREHAAQALTQAAASKDASMFEHLLPMAPADGGLTIKEQESIARAAWKLGGSAMLGMLDGQIGGVAPAALESCRDIFTGIEGEKAFSQLAVAGIEREATRSRALDKKEERGARRQAIFGLAVNHWSSLSDEQKLRCAVGVSSWNEPTLWAKAEERISGAGQKPGSAIAPSMAFYDYCFSSREIARAIFGAAKDESMKSLARAAQMSAATRDDAELAIISTVDAGLPSTEESIARAARLDHTGAMKSLLARVEGQTMKGLLSRALIPQGSAKAHFLDPELPSHELSASACRELVEAGATFDPRDLEGEGAALISSLAKRAKEDKISAEREKCFSILALRGAIPESAWMDKASILAREPMLLEFASDSDRNNADTVGAAVKADGMALRFAGPMAKATLSVASAACAQNVDAIHCVHPVLAKALSLNEANCQAGLAKAWEDSQSINPFKMLSKKSAQIAEKSAQDAARSEMESSARARSLDFLPLERAIADAKLREQERPLAEMALTRAKSIRSAFEKSGLVSNLDLADLRRVVEKNLPDLINRYAATDPAARDSYDGDTRSTPNKMLKSGLTDAFTTMEGISERADSASRRAMQGESVVLHGKAATSGILMERNASDARDAAKEDQALSKFGQNVDGAVGVVADSSSVPKAPKSGF